MTHIIRVTREERGTKFTYRRWGLEGPGRSWSWPGSKGKGDFNIAYFHAIKLVAFTHVMWSKYFLSHLILTLNRCQKNRIRSRWEISFRSHYFDHRSGHSQNHVKYHTFLTFIRRFNIVHNVNNLEHHKLLGIDAGYPLSDMTPKRTDLLAVV